MSNELREKAGLVYNIVESVILAMSVGLMVWLANVVIVHGNQLASQSAQINSLGSRVDTIEQHGSRSLEAHVTADDRRVDDLSKRMEKLETAVILLQSAPGELKAINARLDSLREGQSRIEKVLDEQMKKP